MCHKISQFGRHRKQALLKSDPFCCPPKNFTSPGTLGFYPEYCEISSKVTFWLQRKWNRLVAAQMEPKGQYPNFFIYLLARKNLIFSREFVKNIKFCEKIRM